MKGWKIFFFFDIVIMFVLALTCYDWKGIFIVEGILTGLGFAAANIIQKNKREKKD